MIVQQILCAAVTIYWVVLLVRVLLSWVPALPDPLRPLERGLRAITDPVVAPIRGVMPPAQVGAVAIDLSFIVLFLIVFLLRTLLCGGR